jgi:hypothetical protein
MPNGGLNFKPIPDGSEFEAPACCLTEFQAPAWWLSEF